MIQLASPWALLALLSVPAIIALHVLRPRRRTVHVSSTALWREAIDERQRGLGLQRLLRSLSLLLVLLAAAAASLALTGPQWIAPATESADTVVLLDTSASMNARTGASTRFEQAREQAAALVDALPDGSRMLIMTTGRDAVLRSGFENGKDTLRQVLASIEPGHEAGRPAHGVSLALSLLSDRDNARVDFITDGAFDAHGVRAAPQLRYHLVGTPAQNVAITRFDFRAEPRGGDRFQVLVRLRNYTGETVTAPLTVTLERRTLLSRDVTIPPGGQRTVVLPLRGKALGRATARIDVDDDLALDNAAFAVVNVAEPLRVTLVTPGNLYLQSVLEEAPGIDVTTLDAIDAQALEREAAVNDVVVVDRVPLPRLPAGSFLLIDSVADGLPLRDSGTTLRPTIAGVGESALLEGVDLTGVNIDEARRMTLHASGPGVQRLFWSRDSELAVALLTPLQRVVYLGFDVARSNLPLKAAFPLFMSRVLDWLRGEAGDTQGRAARTWFAAGETVTIRGSAAHDDLVMRTPTGEGSSHALDGGLLSFDDTGQTGIYRYSIAGVARYFAVNLTDEAESDPARRADIRQQPAPAASSATSLLITPLWPYLTMALLVLLALEWVVWCAGRRRA